ncbi:MAG: HlyD family secretion protein [Magnetococcus sp. DMHC-6]
MKRLRDNLIILPVKEGDVDVHVRDPDNGKVYEFGAQEFFLLTSLRDHVLEIKIISQFKDRFQIELSVEDLQQFIKMLDDWGLLQEEDALAVSGAGAGDFLLPSTPTAHDSQESSQSSLEASQTPSTPPPRSLFSPELFLDALLVVLKPFRGLIVLTPLFFLFALTALLFNISQFKQDYAKIHGWLSMTQHLIFTFFTIDLFCQIGKAVTARFYGVRVSRFGIFMAYWLIPRFKFHLDPIRELPKKAQMTIVFSSSMVRLLTFCFGLILWRMSRTTGTALPTFAVMLTSFSALSFFFAANPLFWADGYQVLALYLEMPNLRMRAWRAFFNSFKKRPVAIVRHSGESFALRLYGLTSIVYLLGLFGFAIFITSSWLELHLSGTGVFLFLLLFFYISLRLKRMLQKARGAPLAVAPPPFSAPSPPSVAKKINGGITKEMGERRISYLLFCLFLLCLLLPYRYEIGGNCELLPIAQRSIYADIPGIVEKVYFDGSEQIKQGTILAQMVKYHQEKNVETTQLSVAMQDEEIKKMLTTPSTADIELIQQQIKTARLHVKYSQKQLERTEKLYGKGVASEEKYQEVLENLEINSQLVLEKEALLKSTKEQINPHLVESAKLERKRLEEELRYYHEDLNRTALRMPIDGRLVTMNLKNLENTYLKEGDLFAMVEDARQVQIKIDVPESDFGEVKMGYPVLLKVWSYPTRPFYGTVTVIYPSSKDTDYGKVIEVVSVISNEAQLLQSGMTGYAKIQGREMLVAEAFSRAVVRFLTVEVWSWLP